MSDLMSSMDLSIWPQLAMVIFGGVFVLIAIRTMRLTKTELQNQAERALRDDPVV